MVWPAKGLFGASWDGCGMRGRHGDVPWCVPLLGQFAPGMNLFIPFPFHPHSLCLQMPIVLAQVVGYWHVAWDNTIWSGD